MAKKLKSIRWTLHMAAVEFDLDDKTLEKNIKSSGVVPGKDGKFSTLDVCRAIYGDLKGDLIRAQTRDTNEAADIKAVKKANLLRENIPAVLVVKVWSGVIEELRQKILFAEVPDKMKQELLRDLQEIPTDEYFQSSNPRTEDDSADDSEST